ncbi:hypothetical protein [Parabacteroides chinchillae]|uniref:Uncharacterized protein n=1 Tax=Parabacteroides chinchillae TaxID=871327 RepID=A0A8G2F376_9BACT|nr:hypothetical protein [Parabacteroides chinchillae]SEG02195.1 hypothetical protein SAMN05444001_11270 [Parabacteroides chinchillae]
MKNILFIIGLLIGMFLLAPEDGVNRDNNTIAANQETIMKEKTSADIQHHLEILSSELKGSNGLTPRRNIQTTNYNFELRIQKGAEKTLQFIRLKGINVLHKVSETNSDCHTINLSTLLCRMGHHIFVLRKLII